MVEAAQAEAETEEKPPIPAEEIAPDAALAPPAEAPPEKIPPNDQAGWLGWNPALFNMALGFS